MGRLEAIGISANLSLVSMVFGFDLVKFSSSMTAMRDLLSSLMSICRLPGLDHIAMGRQPFSDPGHVFLCNMLSCPLMSLVT